MWTGVGAGLGGVIGWLLGQKTSKRVDETHDKLTWLIRGIEAEGMVTFHRDENDSITGAILHASAAITGTSSVTAEATITTRKRHWWSRN
jgi:hypothetical protein